MSRVWNPTGPVGQDASLDRGERVALLAAHPAFAALPVGALGLLADALVDECYEQGAVVFAQDDFGDRLLVVGSGEAEISRAGSAGEIPLAVLGAGELVGEGALLSPERRRNATLTALSPLVLLSLDAHTVDDLLVAYPADPRGARG